MAPQPHPSPQPGLAHDGWLTVMLCTHKQTHLIIGHGDTNTHWYHGGWLCVDKEEVKQQMAARGLLQLCHSQPLVKHSRDTSTHNLVQLITTLTLKHAVSSAESKLTFSICPLEDRQKLENNLHRLVWALLIRGLALKFALAWGDERGINLSSNLRTHAKLSTLNTVTVGVLLNEWNRIPFFLVPDYKHIFFSL